jgi:rhodanese-related sulfurtransferase
MPKTFMQMAREAMAQVPGIKPEDAYKRMKADPKTVVVDVRDVADTVATGLVPDSVNISLGMLAVRADQELPEAFRNPDLQDRSRPVITICSLGPNSARGARELKEMGFSNVAFVEGGMQAWIEADLPTNQDTR